MKKTVFEYQKFIGKKKHVSSRITLSEQASKFYNVLVIIAFFISLILIILSVYEVIDFLPAVLLVFACIVLVIAVPIIITVKDKGKEAVRQEIEQNKVTEVFDSSAEGPVYIERNPDTMPTIIDNKNNAPINIADETDTNK